MSAPEGFRQREGLLKKTAQDLKSGAGQYFTTRGLIAAMVDCIAPKPGETVCDPACGTGGFPFTAHNVVARHPNLTKDEKRLLKEGRLPRLGAQATARAMNLLLHAHLANSGSDKHVPVVVADALAADISALPKRLSRSGKGFLTRLSCPFGRKRTDRHCGIADRADVRSAESWCRQSSARAICRRKTRRSVDSAR